MRRTVWETRARFLKKPADYAIQLGGACAFMAASGAPPGSGDPSRFFVHAGRTYILATENCRDMFKLAPERYIPSADAAARE